ncbi:MAG: hypothetical protein ACOYB2_11115 [Limnohabitans sp.]
MDEFCRCDGTPMNGSDHCPACFCEQFEERDGCKPDPAEMLAGKVEVLLRAVVAGLRSGDRSQFDEAEARAVLVLSTVEPMPAPPVAEPRDEWVVGGGGSETPFLKDGHRWLKVWNPKTREHGFLGEDDVVVNDREFYAVR